MRKWVKKMKEAGNSTDNIIKWEFLTKSQEQGFCSTAREKLKNRGYLGSHKPFFIHIHYGISSINFALSLNWRTCKSYSLDARGDNCVEREEIKNDECKAGIVIPHFQMTQLYITVSRRNKCHCSKWTYVQHFDYVDLFTTTQIIWIMKTRNYPSQQINRNCFFWSQVGFEPFFNFCKYYVLKILNNKRSMFLLLFARLDIWTHLHYLFFDSRLASLCTFTYLHHASFSLSVPLPLVWLDMQVSWLTIVYSLRYHLPSVSF